MKEGVANLPTQGVEFLHENNVAHRYGFTYSSCLPFLTLNCRDCTTQNIMLDPSNMYPESFHPVVTDRSKDFRRKAKAYSRTWRPTRYLLIDFGHSRLYDSSKGPPLDEPLRGGDKSAPEHQNGTLCDPFPTDVYYIGNLVRENYLQVQNFLLRPQKMCPDLPDPEIQRVRVYRTTHRQHGSRRSFKTPHHGRGQCSFFGDEEEYQYLEVTLENRP
jgi:serine/threonine protein kinase